MTSKTSIQAASILGTLLPGFAGPDLPDWLEARLRDGLAGVCLFATNIRSREQLRDLTDAIRRANPFALIAIDEEGGDVTRLYSDQGSPYPGNALLGRIDDVDLTRRVAVAVGEELREAGVNLDLAPDVDINSNPDNPVIGVRSFGADPGLVSRHTAAWVEGLESTGVASSPKHFPGHGDTAQDSHLALPIVDQSLAALRERELVPFVAAIAAGARTVMTSHILLPQLDSVSPATLSPTILRGLLREELGFDGVIVTDALDMAGASASIGIPQAAVRALAAGSDLLCIGTDNTDAELTDIVAAIDAALAASLSHERLTDAAARVRALATDLSGGRVAEAARGRRVSRPSFDLHRAISAFDIKPDLPPITTPTIVTLETTANIAVGASPWGLAAAGVAVVPIREGDALDYPAQNSTLVIVGKDNHRRPWVRDLVDGARERHPSVVVIDMGWPSDDREYADIATFGSSQYVGRALAEWLSQESARKAVAR